jgi:hypothetical protein
MWIASKTGLLALHLKDKINQCKIAADKLKNAKPRAVRPVDRSGIG